MSDFFSLKTSAVLMKPDTLQLIHLNSMFYYTIAGDSG